jgi:hypothetical protein
MQHVLVIAALIAVMFLTLIGVNVWLGGHG